MKDLIIIGAGPAACSAAIYARRFEMSVTLIYDLIGGLITKAHLVENWPGEKSLSGFELGQKLWDHAESVGAEGVQSHVEKITKRDDGIFEVTAGGEKHESKAVLVTSGTFPRKLGIPGEDEFLGKGVSYCAVCDAGFFKGKTVAVIGGSDSACNDCELLSKHAEKVFIIYRQKKLRAEDANVKAVEKCDNVKIIFEANPKEIKGGEKVEKLVLDTGQELAVDGVFVAIGREPLTGMLDEVEVEFSEKGEIVVDEKKMTKTPGLFGAGDVTPGIKQAITAAASAVEAVFGIREWLRDQE